MLDTLASARPFYAFVPASAAHAKARSQAAGAVPDEWDRAFGVHVCVYLCVWWAGGAWGGDRGAVAQVIYVMSDGTTQARPVSILDAIQVPYKCGPLYLSICPPSSFPSLARSPLFRCDAM